MCVKEREGEEGRKRSCASCSIVGRLQERTVATRYIRLNIQGVDDYSCDLVNLFPFEKFSLHLSFFSLQLRDATFAPPKDALAIVTRSETYRAKT